MKYETDLKIIIDNFEDKSPPASNGDISRVENELGINLPDFLKFSLSISNGFGGDFEENNGDYIVFYSTNKIILENKFVSENLNVDLKSLIFGNDGSGEYFCVRQEDNREIFYAFPKILGSERDLKFLSVGFDDFLKKAIGGILFGSEELEIADVPVYRGVRSKKRR